MGHLAYIKRIKPFRKEKKMLRIFADALLLVTRQAPMPAHSNRRPANPDIEEARNRRTVPSQLTGL